uniref:Chloride channel protein n=1 Tax=Rhizochromulina marina TaxID=1034831 RepID=A0A7S2WW69_9STRA
MGRRHSEMLTSKKDEFESQTYLPSVRGVHFDGLHQRHLDGSPEPSTNFLRWAMNGFIGFACGVTAFLLKESIGVIFRSRAVLMDSVLPIATDADSHSSDITQERGWLLWGWFCLAPTSAAIVLLSSSIIVFLEPKAAGSGIPETMSFLNGIIIPKTFTLTVFLAKFMSCLLAVGSGLPVGPEGPMIHMGAILGTLGSVPARVCGIAPLRWLDGFVKPFRTVSDRRDFMSAGVAGGVAAAFGAPIGGLLFVAEEIATHWRVALGMQIFFTAMVACSTVLLFASAFEDFQFTGHFGIFREEVAIMFDVNKATTANISMFLPTILLGGIAGLGGVVFIRLTLLATKFRNRYIKPHRLRFLLEPVAISLVYSSCVVLIPSLFTCRQLECEGTSEPGCERVGLSAVDTQPRVLLGYGCPLGWYNPSASLFIHSGEKAIQILFARGYHYEFDYLHLLVMSIVYLPLSAYCNGISCSTGILVPSLLNGAILGRLLGLALTDLCGADTSDSTREWIDPGAFALLGAAAFLAGATRLAMAITVIMVEISNDGHFILPIMSAVLVAKWVADFTHTPPIYHALIDRKNFPYLPEAPHVNAPLELFTAGHVATNNVVTVAMKPTARSVARTLLSCEHNGFPVTFDSYNGPVCLGMVTREQLISLLRSRGVSASDDMEGASAIENGSYQRRHPQGTKPRARNIPSEASSAEDLHFLSGVAATDQSMGITIDLEPYLDTAVVTVCETFPLRNTYVLFRSMGLRHLVVVDVYHCVIGIITRHNLLEANLEASASVERLVTPTVILRNSMRIRANGSVES